MRIFFVYIGLFSLISCNSNYQDGERLFNEQNYKESKIKLRLVGADDSHFNEAQRLIQKVDSIYIYNYRQDFIRDSISRVRYEAQQDSIREIERLERIELLQTDIYDHIENLKNISQLNNYTTNSMIMKIGLFASIANKCNSGLRINTSEFNRSAKECQTLLRKVQLKEYPIMRDNYASVLTGEFVDYDIWVKCEGPKNKTLVLIGDYFVLKHRIPEIHDLLRSKLEEFRFDAVSYRWSSKYPNGTRYGVGSKPDDWLGMP